MSTLKQSLGLALLIVAGPSLANPPDPVESLGVLSAVMSAEATDCTLTVQEGSWTWIIWRHIKKDGSAEKDRGSFVTYDTSRTTIKCHELGIAVGTLCSDERVDVRISVRTEADLLKTHPMSATRGWAPPPGWIIDQRDPDAAPGLKHKIKSALIVLEADRECASI